MIRAFLVAVVLLPAAAHAACDTDALGAALGKLDKSHPLAVDAGARLTLDAIHHADDTCAGPLFLRYLELYESTEEAASAQLQDHGPDTPQGKALVAEAAKVGWRVQKPIDVSLGDHPSFVQGTSWLPDRFRNDLPAPFIEYLDQSAVESGSPKIDHAELRKRVRFWEDFLTHYPDFPLIAGVRGQLDVYLGGYLTSDVLGPDGRYRPEVLADFRDFAAKEKGSPHRNLVRDFAAALGSYNGKPGYRALKLLKQHHLPSLFPEKN